MKINSSSQILEQMTRKKGEEKACDSHQILDWHVCQGVQNFSGQLANKPTQIDFMQRFQIIRCHWVKERKP